MKKIFYFLLFSAGTLHSFAQLKSPFKAGSKKVSTPLTQARMEALVYKPTLVTTFTWNSTTNAYDVVEEKSYYTYDANGNQLTHKVYDGNGNLYDIDSSTYNDQGKQSSDLYLYFSPTGKVWGGGQELYIYDANGNTIQAISKSLDSTMSIIKSDRSDFTYNTNNEISTETDYIGQGSNWIPTDRYYDVTFYNSHLFLPSAYKQQSWNGSAWVDTYVGTGGQVGNYWVVTMDTISNGSQPPVNRTIYGMEEITLGDKIFQYSKDEYFVDSQWVPSEVNAPTSTAGGGILDADTAYDENGQVYRISRIEYDKYGNEIFDARQALSDGNVTSQSETKTINTYDNNGTLLSKEVLYFDPSDSSWVNANKTIYGDIQSFETDLSNETLNVASLRVYPNPSTGGIFHLDTPVDYQVANLQGAAIANGTGTTIDLGHQPKGIYLLRLGASGQQTMKKLIVE